MREFKFLYALALITIIAAALSACAQQNAQTAEAVSAPMRQTLSGSYLAGRFAQRQQDWNAAQNYMSEVLAYDQNNDQMLQRTFLLALGSGNFARAKDLAEKIIALKQNEGNELALIFLSCDALVRDDFAASLAFLKKLPTEGFGQYTKPLLTAWSLAGQGKKVEAIKMLATHAAPDDPAFRMHAGMMEEMSGDVKAAAENYKVAMANGLNLHTALVVGNFFERNGRPEITHNIYQGLDKIYAVNSFTNALAGHGPQSMPLPNIRHAADGAALALFDLATLLYEKRAYDSAQVYGSLTQMLSPSSPFARMMMGDLAALHDQYSEAIKNYEAIDAASPIYWLGRVRAVDVYEASGRTDEAIRMLTDLAKNEAVRRQAQVTLGDIYRRHGQFQDAVDAYNQALAGEKNITEEHWPIIYARGMAEERLNHWSRAEKDLLQALSFQPDNPMILNFIAYSWANQGINLEKALAYIKHAAELRPDDGYILDSYGWTLFRLSKYKECVTWLEQAVDQIPGDSTLLDHLGDAYWQVGRKDEARHQWRQARDLSQDPAFKALADQKLIHGIVPATPSQTARNDAKL